MVKLATNVLIMLAALFTLECAHGEQPSVAALISDTANPYWKTFEDGLKETARERGLVLSIYSLRNATDAEEQLNKCEAALLKQPQIILFAAVNGLNLATCLRKAARQGSILVDVDGNVSQEVADKMGVAVAFSVASNNYELGARAAHYLKDEVGEILVIEGIGGSQPSLLRVEGFRENLGEGLRIIASQPGDWDRIKGADIASRAILRHPQLTAIFAANDTMALGALEAVRSAGRSDIKVIGIDATSDAIKSIRDGRLTASIAQLPYLMAKEALIKASNYFEEKQTISFNQYVPILAIDRSILDANQEPLLQYLR